MNCAVASGVIPFCCNRPTQHSTAALAPASICGLPSSAWIPLISSSISFRVASSPFAAASCSSRSALVFWTAFIAASAEAAALRCTAAPRPGCSLCLPRCRQRPQPGPHCIAMERCGCHDKKQLAPQAFKLPRAET